MPAVAEIVLQMDDSGVVTAMQRTEGRLQRLGNQGNVILTGLGHDGQAGVRAIAHCGGVVLAQDAATSAFHSMPAAAIATDQVQQVLPLDQIADAILRHVRRG